MAEATLAVGVLSLAANVIQVLSFASTVAREALILVQTGASTVRDIRVVQDRTRTYHHLTSRALPTLSGPMTDDEIFIDNLMKECKNEAASLLQLVENLRLEPDLHGGKRLWDGMKKIPKAIWKLKNEISDKQRHLDNLNQQLALGLIRFGITMNLHLFEEMLSGIKNEAHNVIFAVLRAEDVIMKMLERQNELADLNARQQIDLLNRIGSEAQTIARKAQSDALEQRTKLERLEKFELDKQEQKRSQQIMDCLDFDQMFARQADISDSHPSTFKWILQDNGPFKTWLAERNGVFWIKGKAGSGKSTLMKFIANHRLTKRLLENWAGVDSDKNHNKLLIVQVYFWYAGSSMQKSQEGLLRSILFQIFDAYPSLIPLACPERWIDANKATYKSRPWGREELIDSLNVVKNLENCRLCLFIDGLDEFQASHTTLVNELDKLAACANVKVCVSSRPWNVFESAYGRLHGNLTLEKLTREDIREYVEKELVKPLPNMHALADEIVDKADGVFLWVFLAVKSLRDGSEEHDPVEILKQRLEDLPSDLELFFRKILERIPKIYRSYTARALYLKGFGLDTLPDGHQDSFILYWLLGHGLERPDFALELPIKHYTKEDLRSMVHETDHLLKARCKDFVYVQRSPPQRYHTRSGECEKEHPPEKTIVGILHKTVYEFLKTEAMSQFFEQNAIPKHWHDAHFRCQWHLAEIKLWCPFDSKSEGFRKSYDFEKRLRGLCQGPLTDQTTQCRPILQELGRSLQFYISHFRGCNASVKFREGSYPRPDHAIFRPKNIPGHDYSLDHSLSTSFLSILSQHPWYRCCCQAKETNDLATALGQSREYCFDLGMVDVNEIASLLRGGAKPNESYPGDASPWEIFLLRSFQGRFEEDHLLRVWSPSVASNPEPADCTKTWRIIVLFVEHGANIARLRIRQRTPAFSHDTTASHATIRGLLRATVPREHETELERVLKNSTWQSLAAEYESGPRQNTGSGDESDFDSESE